MIEFFIKKTFSSLKYLKSIILVIASAVVFGAGVSMALLTLSNSFSHVLVDDPKAQFYGDVKVSMMEEIEEEILKYADDLKEQGIVEEFSKQSISSMGNLKHGSKTPYVGLHGLWDSSFPLYGNFVVKETEQNALELLQNEYDVLLSNRIAEELGLKVGDTVHYLGMDYFSSQKLNIVGIVTESPDPSNSNVYLRGEDLEKIVPDSYSFLYLKGDEKKITEALREELGETFILETVSEYVESNLSMYKPIDAFLRSISILGLFVGSIGIATSMNVVIQRRKGEIGILKTLGFSRFRVFLMFLLELVLISAIGGIVGIVLGFLFANYLKDLFEAIGINVTLGMGIDLRAAGISLLATIFSSVLFSLVAIDRYVSLKPLVIIKDLPIVSQRRDVLRNIFLFTLVGALFTGLSILVTKSVEFGIGVVLVSVVGVFLAGLVMQIVLGLVVKLPLSFKNVWGLAWLTLRANYKKYVLASMAIFIGLTVLNLLMAVFKTTNMEYDERFEGVETVINSVVYSNPEDAELLLSYISENEDVKNFYVRYRAKVDGSVMESYQIGLEGRDLDNYSADISVVSGELKEDSMIVSEFLQDVYQVGNSYEVIINDSVYSFEVSGYYNRDNSKTIDYRTGEIIISDDKFLDISSDYQTVVDLEIENEKVGEVSNDIRNLGENYIVMDSQSLVEMVNSSIIVIKKLFFSMSGLALLAGVVLIVNATLLEVINRKRVFGIYKALGFTSSQVTAMFILEYAIVLSIVSILALGIGYGITRILSEFSEEIFDFAMEIHYDWNSSVIVSIASCLVISILIFLVSRNTLKTKPSEILRYE